MYENDAIAIPWQYNINYGKEKPSDEFILRKILQNNCLVVTKSIKEDHEGQGKNKKLQITGDQEEINKQNMEFFIRFQNGKR